MSDSGEDTSCEVEEEVAEVAEFIFDDIAEDPEEEHVSGDMPEPAVQECACDELPEVWCCMDDDTVVVEYMRIWPEVKLE